MTQYEVLKMSEPVMEQVACGGITATDIAHVEMYEELVRLEREGHKKEWILAYLGERFGVTRRNIYKIKARMKKEICLY